MGVVADVLEEAAQIAEKEAERYGPMCAYGAEAAARRIRERAKEVSTIINDDRQAEAWWAIIMELQSNKRALPTEALRRTALMTEEAGEALKAALDVTRYPITPEELVAKQNELWNETVQTGAMALANLITMIDDRERAWKEAKVLS